MGRGRDVHLHAAHGVDGNDRGWGRGACGLRLGGVIREFRAASELDDLAEDRQRHFLWTAGAEIEARWIAQPLDIRDPALGQPGADRRAALVRGHQADVRQASFQGHLERRFVVMPLRRDDGRAFATVRGSLAENGLEPIERRDASADRRGIGVDVALLRAVHHPHHVVAHRPRNPRHRGCNRRGSGNHDRARPDDWFNVHVHRALRRAGHWYDHALRVGSAASFTSGRIDTSRAARVRSTSSACFRMISREQAPPTNPSIRPSAKMMARSPR